MSTATKPAAFPLPIPVDKIRPGASIRMFRGDVVKVTDVRVYLGGLTVFYVRGGVDYSAGIDMFRAGAHEIVSRA